MHEVLEVYALYGSSASSIFLEGLKTNILIIVDVSLLEAIQPIVRSDLLQIGRNVARGIIRVLNFHADERRFVDEGPRFSCFPCCDSHVQIKALISLILAILDAG